MRFSKAVVRYRIPILIVTLALMIPAVLGMCGTRINYDMLDYLPDSMDTVIGQDQLLEDFGKGAFSFIVVENMPDRDVATLCEKIKGVEHVETVLWYSTLADLSIPKEILPDELYREFNSDNATLVAVFFDSATSADVTMDAIREIRSLTGKQCFVSGMSALVTDLKDLCEKEEPIYVGLAVLCAMAAMMLLLDGWLVPFVFLASIGVMILLNLGSNYFFGEISYITKAIAAVLQLGVTMDYSIFLYHRYEEERPNYDDKRDAMAQAVVAAFRSLSSSSLTTVAGFLALCVMRLTLGRDIGIVMAKGVVLGVATVILALPSLVLIFDKQITKHKHKSLMPSFDKVNSFILRHNKVIMVIFVLLFIPAYYAQSHAGIYYKLDESLPRDLPSIVSNEKLKNDFDMATSHFIVLRDDLNPAEMSDIENRMEEVKGVTSVVSYHKMLGTGIPDFFIPNEVKDMLKQGGYQLMMVNSSYSPATDAVAAQLDEMNAILKQYDENAMITGEGAMYRDLIDTTAVDFVVANYLSIACIFIIVAWAFKSITVPAVLVATIELAIFLNQGFSYFSGASTPFIAPTIISCVQLGATVDYAILMTSRFQEELQSGKNRKEAIRIAADSADASIITSALVMFCATLGVSFVSSIDLIGAICIMLARGALISACICLFVMPAVLYVCEPMFNKTTLRWRTEQPKKESKAAKALKAASEKLPARKEKAALPEKGTEQTETTEPAEAADSTKLAAESETEADAARETANV